MKKKLLSLVLAGAMVASTSVSAFAAGNEQSYDVPSKGERNAQVEITGNIADENDEVVPGTISVTVPTTANFTVDKDGNLTGSKITIKNNGNEAVSVIAHKFIDTTTNSKITVVKASEISSTAPRTNVSLTLGGSLDTVALKSASSSTDSGIYKLDGDTKADENTVLGNVTADQPLTLSLEGTAGTNGDPLTEAVNDTFTLILKLKREK